MSFAAGPTVLAPGATHTVGSSVSDIDLTGNIVYAIDSGSGADRTLAGVLFEGSQAGAIAGYTQSTANVSLGWGSYDIGATIDDDTLETMLADIQCCDTTFGSPATYAFAVPNGLFQVQLLFGEKGSANSPDHTRPFDIEIEGLTTDEINVVGLLNADGSHAHPDAGTFDFDGDGTLNDQFSIYMQNVEVTDGILNIRQGQIVGDLVGGDRNQVLSAIIVEQVPEPASAALFAAGAIGFLARRRRC